MQSHLELKTPILFKIYIEKCKKVIIKKYERQNNPMLKIECIHLRY